MNIIDHIRTFIEQNKKIRTAETAVLFLLRAGILFSFITGLSQLNRKPGDIRSLGSVEMIRDREREDYDEDYTICDVIYTNGEDSLTVSYTYEEYEQLDADSITAYGYETSDGTRLFFTSSDPSLQQITVTYRNV